MRNIVLRPTTIIPQNLYVERAADRQLDVIVEEMGRPGYVLVARQMGKTNLLINMKRKREAAGDVVLYQDLSNRYSSSRTLFRSIIDALIETAFDEHSPVVSKILQQRDSGGVEPNNEYDRHLRLLLKAQPEKRFIIVFDEIDSLVSASYSDAVFAQIRSMYFSRVNYPEYDRLTYVLSGVAEPTDLIKDKNISPFNIGEKIYLNDFTYDEYKSFIKKANLEIPEDVTREIYSWTSGNPRMTWDVTAGVESAAAAGSNLDKTLVRSVVDKLYLTRFDLAPIDHIRVLVESDPLIRSAVVTMRWNKGETLDERTRGRLYLAGITSAATTEAPVIKNRIIDAALSDAWLAEIAAGKRSLLEAASDSYLAGAYDQAVRFSEEAIREQGAGYEMPFLSRLQLGISRYHLNDYERASSDLELALKVCTDEAAAPSVRFYLASALLKGGRPADALPLFEAAAVGGEFQQNAKLALASTYMSLGVNDNFERIVALGDDIIEHFNSIAEERALTDQENVVRVSAHYNNAQAYLSSKNRIEAKNYIARALEFRSLELSPRLMIMMSDIVESASSKREWISRAVDTIVDGKIKFVNDGNNLSFNESNFALLLVRSILLEDADTFEKLALYGRDTLYHSVHTSVELIYKLARSAAKADENAICRTLLWKIYSDYDIRDLGEKKRFEFYQLLVQTTGKYRLDLAISMYVDTYNDRKALIGLTEEDFVLLLDAAYAKVGSHDYKGALALIDLAEENNSAKDEPFLSLIAAAQRQSIYNTLNDVANAQRAAQKVLELIDESELDSAGAEISGSISFMRQAAINTLRLRTPDPFRNIGRNEQVTVVDTNTGTTITAKFKKVEAELRSGRYRLVS